MLVRVMLVSFSLSLSQQSRPEMRRTDFEISSTVSCAIIDTGVSWLMSLILTSWVRETVWTVGAPLLVFSLSAVVSSADQFWNGAQVSTLLSVLQKM